MEVSVAATAWGRVLLPGGRPGLTLCVSFQRSEHVRHVDGDPAFHSGAVQPEGFVPEDGGQGNEPPPHPALHR